MPAIRAKVRQHMGLRGLPREKVLATVVHLLETTLIRIGNDDYAKHNKSYGLTTLKRRHVAVDGSEVRFRFTGKSSKQWSLAVRDRRVANIIKACGELPGQELLQYLDGEGTRQDVTSSDVNGYLKEITGQDITAKDFRTWAGTVLAALALKEVETFDTAAQGKRNLRAAIGRVAARLGNTPTICRKCYVHPAVLDAYLDGELVLEIKPAVESELCDDPAGLRPEEAAVLAMLRARLKRAVDPGASLRLSTTDGVRRPQAWQADGRGAPLGGACRSLRAAGLELDRSSAAARRGWRTAPLLPSLSASESPRRDTHRKTRPRARDPARSRYPPPLRRPCQLVRIAAGTSSWACRPRT